jgi:hypothetical protein
MSATVTRSRSSLDGDQEAVRTICTLKDLSSMRNR